MAKHKMATIPILRVITWCRIRRIRWLPRIRWIRQFLVLRLLRAVRRRPQVPILRADANNDGGGTYRYEYETGNGISAQEQGDARGDGTRAQGGFSYTAPDGQQVSIQYTADENGFVPQGSHIPTPPPVPEEIQRALQQNLADEARGIVDDGQYREDNSGQYRDDGAGQYRGDSSGFGRGGAGLGGGSGFGKPQGGGYRY
ncbi:hypothetical protein NQ318_004362 [Aromia moschata]|uniref:Uncharacterized protein n=1 Tax=Aromia moschata TaxID=1265417 RepID=A0AAV8YTR6_9CUCU|nr:hypothetical protein NQ318_004362 [Aromia moschata]